MFRTFTRLFVVLTTTLAVLVGSLTPVAAQSVVLRPPVAAAASVAVQRVMGGSGFGVGG